MEFAFSIINVALGNVSSLLELRSRALRIAWLLYSLTHIPLALMVTFLQREFGKEDNLVFWNYMYVCCRALSDSVRLQVPASLFFVIPPPPFPFALRKGADGGPATPVEAKIRDET